MPAKGTCPHVLTLPRGRLALLQQVYRILRRRLVLLGGLRRCLTRSVPTTTTQQVLVLRISRRGLVRLSMLMQLLPMGMVLAFLQVFLLPSDKDRLLLICRISRRGPMRPRLSTQLPPLLHCTCHKLDILATPTKIKSISRRGHVRLRLSMETGL